MSMMDIGKIIYIKVKVSFIAKKIIQVLLVILKLVKKKDTGSKNKNMVNLKLF